MVALINASMKAYNHVFCDLVDHRSDDWFLMRSPWPSVFIVTMYVYFVKHLGPRLMKDRPAFNVDKLLNVYNLFQICACAYLVERAYSLGWGWGCDTRWICEPVNYSNDPEGIKILRGFYHYYLLKISDLLDTVFFVLRKKNNQISFLHVYHHALMVIVAWFWAKYVPGGHGSLAGALNCFVHVWMYFYYFVTSMWPEHKQSLWWKKYITQLQMIQFGVVFVHTLPLFFVEDCGYPRMGGVVLTLQSAVFFSLFSNFYVKAYGKKKTE